MVIIVTGAVLALLGVALAVGGAWLAALGGSWYYLLAAVGFLAAGALLLARRAEALWVHALTVVGSLAWAVLEVGFDWWQLAPRGGLVVLLGLWLLTPWVVRGLRWGRDDGAAPAAAPWRRAGLPLAAGLALSLGAAAYSVTTPPRLGLEGSLPTAAAAAPQPDVPTAVPAGEWRAYGRTGFGQRYAPLDQITAGNVDRLEVAWTYHTGDLRRPTDPLETTYEVTPLMVGGTLYLCTPHNFVIALDAETGEERWRFDPEVPDNVNRQHLTCRGVSYHEAEGAPPGGACARRIFMPTADARLIALDAGTGEVCEGFGERGAVDLWANMPNVKPGFYYSTSPPVVTRDLVVVGGAVNDNVSTTEPSGVVRAYDARTGALVWNWDSGNPDAARPIAEGGTYTANSPNMWSIASVDEGLGLVYLPMGNRMPDQWGAMRDRPTERFSSSVVALELATGRVRWVFQTVHHDLWDYDVPAQPSLVDLTVGGETVPALVQPTKQGEVFVLDRRNGAPVLPVEEVEVPQGAVSHDVASPTQPVSALSFDPPPLAERDMWGAPRSTSSPAGSGSGACATRGATRRPRSGAASSTPATSACSTGAGWRSTRCARWCSPPPPTSPSSRG